MVAHKDKDQPGRSEDDGSARGDTRSRLRRDVDRAEQTLDKLGDETLDDYERRRQRLSADLTDELPNDSPEPA